MPKLASAEYNLAVKFPKIAEEWHPSRNVTLTPYEVTPVSGQKVWWLCKKNRHEWKAMISYRTNGSGCPSCARYTESLHIRLSDEYNLAVKHPNVAKAWHPTRNGALTPYQVTPKSGKMVWWKCSKNGHEWEAMISSRVDGYGCPYCAGKLASPEYNLAVKFPKVAKEWHPTKNGKLIPSEVTPVSNLKVWWLCKKNKHHEWEAMISSRVNGIACSKCFRLKRAFHQ